jgi:multimeric flavodoxin WrbA
MAAQIKNFIYQAGGLWAKDKLVGKVGSVFTASPPGPRQPAGMLIVVNEGPALPCMLSS